MQLVDPRLEISQFLLAIPSDPRFCDVKSHFHPSIGTRQALWLHFKEAWKPRFTGLECLPIRPGMRKSEIEHPTLFGRRRHW